MAFAGILQRLASPDAIYGIGPDPQATPFRQCVNQHHFAAFIGDDCRADARDNSLRRNKAGQECPARHRGRADGDRDNYDRLTRRISGNARRWRVCSGRSVLDWEQARDRNGKASSGTRVCGRSGRPAASCGGCRPVSRRRRFAVPRLGFHEGQGDITSGRSHFWDIGWQIFLAHPILGAGFDAFGSAFTRYDTWNGLYRVEQAHNDYLQMLADGGVLAFACVAAFIVLFFRRGLQVINNSADDLRRSIAIGAMAGAFGILIHSFFDFRFGRNRTRSSFYCLLCWRRFRREVKGKRAVSAPANGRFLFAASGFERDLINADGLADRLQNVEPAAGKPGDLRFDRNGHVFRAA